LGTATEPFGHAIGLKLDPPRESFDQGGLADPGLAGYHNGVAPGDVTEYLDDLVYLRVPADDNGQAVEPGQLVEVYGKVFQVGRKFVFFLQLLFHIFPAPYFYGNSPYDKVRVEPEGTEYLGRKAVVLLENGCKDVCGVNGFAAPSTGLFKREPEDVLRGGRDLEAEAYVLS
jgi:hypothetical protein